MILEIDRYIGNTRNRVERAGVELEGAWSKIPDGYRIVGDGSVFRGNRDPSLTCGELHIGPARPIALPKLVTRCYPQKVDASCGMHVHMSFETLRYYGLLMVRDYQDTVVHYLKQWATAAEIPKRHCIWARLQGKVEFCKDEFFPEEQVSNKQKDYDHFRKGNRYTHINYCGRLKTIECRTLPMMDDPETSIRAIMHLINVTNACIYALGRKKEERVSAKLELPNHSAYDESVEEYL